jgi:hypothetical protein
MTEAAEGQMTFVICRPDQRGNRERCGAFLPEHFRRYLVSRRELRWK